MGGWVNSNRIASATLICIEIDNVIDFTSGQEIRYHNYLKVGRLVGLF